MSEVRLRDTRRADWFWVQNVLIDVFQPVIGPLGVTVYNTLCREVRRDVVDVTLRELGELATVSKDTAQRMLWKMQALGMVGVRALARGRKAYVLYDLEDAAGDGATKERIARLERKLAEAEFDAKRKAPAKSRQEAALEQAEPGLFDEPEDTLADEIADAENNHGQGPEAGDSVSVRDKVEGEGLSLPETRCLKTGGVLSQKEGVLSQKTTPYLMLLKDETQMLDRTLPNPPVGRASGDLSDVLAGLGRLKPRQGDVSDLRDQVAAHMRAAGFAVNPEARIGDRGDGRPGTVDLLCERNNPSDRMLPQFVAIECDNAAPRDKSLVKLRRLHAEGAVTTVLLLRTAVSGAHGYPGIDLVIQLGWPGNGAAQAPTRAEAAQAARASVGASPWQALNATPVMGVVAAGIGPEISAASVRRVFAAVRAQVAEMDEHMGFGTLVPEWDAFFGSVAYERHESGLEGSDLAVLVLSSADKAATERGLATYRARLEPEMQRVYGARVLVQVIAGDSG